uniref:Putative secreted protein n=1 Tax=Anopheles triannulatus TaxID=58253 RepID=A0A2M4B7R6_9DIPT
MTGMWHRIHFIHQRLVLELCSTVGNGRATGYCETPRLNPCFSDSYHAPPCSIFCFASKASQLDEESTMNS